MTILPADNYNGRVVVAVRGLRRTVGRGFFLLPSRKFNRTARPVAAVSIERALLSDWTMMFMICSLYDCSCSIFAVFSCSSRMTGLGTTIVNPRGRRPDSIKNFKA